MMMHKNLYLSFNKELNCAKKNINFKYLFGISNYKYVSHKTRFRVRNKKSLKIIFLICVFSSVL